MRLTPLNPILFGLLITAATAHEGHRDPDRLPCNGHTTGVEFSTPGHAKRNEHRHGAPAAVKTGEDALPEIISIHLSRNGKPVEIELRQRSVMSENFKILLDHGHGVVEEHPVDGQVHTYIGELPEDPGSFVSAWIDDKGVAATIECSNGKGWEIRPPAEQGGKHGVFDLEVDPSVTGIDRLTADQRRMLALMLHPEHLISAYALPQTVTVYSAEIGFDVSNRTFREDFKGDVDGTNFSANGDHGKGFENNADLANRYIQSFINHTMNKRYIRDNLIKLVVGVVNIRADQASCPYEGQSTETATLSEFRNIWNGGSSPSNTHALAHAMIGGAGDSAAGRSWVGKIGESYRYSIGGTSNGSGLNYWKGVAKHEITHTWGCSHGDGSNLEFNGNGVGYSLAMNNGYDTTRTNTIEHNKILNERNSSTGALTDIGPIPVAEDSSNPYCVLDNFDVAIGAGPVLLDVLKNDFDANNTPFHIESFTLYADGGQARVDNSTSTRAGATIAISDGTGPGGRDQILYTPPASGTGKDQFLYIVRDMDGRGGTGNVIVNLVSSDPGVLLYRDSNQGGPSAKWTPGLHRQGALNDSDVPSDEASSILVPLNFSVRLYDSDNLFNSSGYRDFGPGIHNLTDYTFLETGVNMNDKVSALRVYFNGPDRPHVELYDALGFQGTAGICNGEEAEVTNGVYRRSRLDMMGIGNDKLSSIRIPPGYTVTLWDSDPPAGDSITLTETVADLGWGSFENRATSMVVSYTPPPPHLEVFSVPGYLGRAAWFATGDYRTGHIVAQGINDDGIAAIKVPAGSQVTLYEDDEFGGASTVLSADVSDLASIGWDSRVSSMKVELAGGDPGPGLVGLYTFDDPGSPLLDDSENGNDLSPMGTTPAYGSSSGSEGGGYTFDGSGQFISPIDISPAAMPQVTLGAWVRTSSLSSGLRKIMGHDNGGWDRTVGIDNRIGTAGGGLTAGATYLRYTAFRGSAGLGTEDVGPIRDTPQPVYTSDWTFVAVTYDNHVNQVEIYVDLDVTSTGDTLEYLRDTALTDGGWNSLAIGGIRPDELSEIWHGSMDNVFIFDEILDQDQLTTIRNDGKSALLAYLPRPELLAFYPFDSTTDPLQNFGTAAASDASIGGGDPVFQSLTGAEGGSYHFDGNDRLISPVDINPATLPAMTWGAWVRTDSLASGLRKVLGHDNGGWDRSFGLDNREPTGDFRYTSFTGNDPVNNSGPVEGTPGPLSTDNWTFLATSYDQAARQVTVYIDLDASTNADAVLSFTEPGAFGAGQSSFAIGGIRPDNANEGWHGNIDNVFVFNGILSASQVTALRDNGRSALFEYNPGVDTDGDGQPDAWELLHFGDFDETALGDSDGDKITNMFERFFGTPPGSPNPAPMQAQVKTLPGQGDFLSLTFDRDKAVADDYEVQATWSTNLVNWHPVARPITIIADDGSTETLEAVDDVPIPDNPQRFLRLELVHAQD